MIGGRGGRGRVVTGGSIVRKKAPGGTRRVAGRTVRKTRDAAWQRDHPPRPPLTPPLLYYISSHLISSIVTPRQHGRLPSSHGPSPLRSRLSLRDGARNRHPAPTSRASGLTECTSRLRPPQYLGARLPIITALHFMLTASHSGPYKPPK